MSSLLIKGFVLGFAIAASPGPIFFLCVRRTLLRGRLHGLFSGFGVATADAFYAALAAFGVAALTGLFLAGRRPLALAGGLILIALGVRILLDRPRLEPQEGAPANSGLAWAYVSTLGLTITNPATIISFAALAASLGLSAAGGWPKPASLVGGVLLGSATWWALLAVGTSMIRSRITGGVVRAISTVSGAAIALLGLLAVVAAFNL
ncbi:MAG TPA: LysE family transporter [Candidatus Sulfotelmatobacter sp.]|nr:LysE family transporter [Candidatus Sulfotelmatobacter sp.]